MINVKELNRDNAWEMLEGLVKCTRLNKDDVRCYLYRIDIETMTSISRNGEWVLKAIKDCLRVDYSDTYTTDIELKEDELILVDKNNEAKEGIKYDAFG